MNVAENAGEIAAIQKSFNDLSAKLDSGYLTKSEFKHEAEKFKDTFAALQKEITTARKLTKTNPVFGTEAEAEVFVKAMVAACNQCADHPEVIKARGDRGSWLQKDLNTYGSGTGPDLVPTFTSDTISFLLAQYGVARANAKVLNGVQGSLVLPKRNGTSTAAFTASGGTTEEDVAVTPSAFGTAKVTLTPQQISILSLVADKLLYASAVNVAEMVAIDVAEQAGVLEDNAVLKGDGSSTYGGITGLVNASIASVSDSAGSGVTNLDKLMDMPSAVHESVYKSKTAKYYMAGAILQKYRQKKASTAGSYFIDPVTGEFTINGYPVEIWQRMDNTIATGKNIVLFGDMAKCVTIGTGREYQLLVSRDYKFNTNQVAFRLSYDFGAVVVQPTAMAVLTLTS